MTRLQQPSHSGQPSLETTSTAVEYTERLSHLLQERLDLAIAIKQISDSQIQAARSGEVNVTLGLIARKQSLLEQLEQLRQGMQPYYLDDPDRRQWKTPERREECQRVANECNAILQQTLQLEQATLEELSAKREALAAQLQDGKDSTIASNAYATDRLLGASTLDIRDL
ncbi:MAG: hypothetical protein KDB22_30190 [Planctomycetales bacterium]|nr:hypothetical protein [Planctomycetales bacterium]